MTFSFSPDTISIDRKFYVDPTFPNLYGLENDYRLEDTDKTENTVKCEVGKFYAELGNLAGPFRGCKLTWMSPHFMLRDAGIDMIPIWIAYYEELRLADALSLPAQMFPHDRRIQNVYNDNKTLIVWEKIQGTGTRFLVSEHRDGQAKLGTVSKIRHYRQGSQHKIIETKSTTNKKY